MEKQILLMLLFHQHKFNLKARLIDKYSSIIKVASEHMSIAEMQHFSIKN